jgi:DNA-binding XRE family transcriptional regulator
VGGASNSDTPDATLAVVPSLAAYASMMRRDRERLGLRECRAAWQLGIKPAEYKRLESGESSPSWETWDAMCKLFDWPRSFA